MALFTSQPLLVIFSTVGFLLRVSVVMCCATLPVGQERKLQFEVSGFTIPVTMAYSTNTEVLAIVPGMSSSKTDASTIIINYIEYAAQQVIRGQAGSMGLIASQINTVIEQLSFSSNYAPIECPYAVHYPGDQQQYSSTVCVIIGNTVSNICNKGPCSAQPTGSMLPIPSAYTTWTGTLSGYEPALEFAYSDVPSVIAKYPKLQASANNAEKALRKCIRNAVLQAIKEEAQSSGLEYLVPQLSQQIQLHLYYYSILCFDMEEIPTTGIVEASNSTGIGHFCLKKGDTITNVLYDTNLVAEVPEEFQSFIVSVSVTNALLAGWSRQTWEVTALKVQRQLKRGPYRESFKHVDISLI